MQGVGYRRVKERYRISIAPGYVVGDDGELYKLSRINDVGQVKTTRKIKSFFVGQGRSESYDLFLNGKKVRVTKYKLRKYYVEVPEKFKRWIVLSDDKQERL
jgi:hypothetical protein